MAAMQPEDPAAALEPPEAVLANDIRRRLPAQDPDALAAFFDAFFPRIYGYLRRMVRDEHLAEDLTQEVFLHLHRALPSYDPERPLRPWVFTIATNKLRDHWRSRRHRQAQSEESADEGGWVEDLAEDEPLPVEALEAEEGDEALREAVDRLPEGMRVTVQMRVYEGLSFEAIGEAIGRNEVAARKRFSRALAELRRLVGPYLDELDAEARR